MGRRLDPRRSATLETTYQDVYAVGDVTSVGTAKAGVFSERQASVVAELESRFELVTPIAETMREPAQNSNRNEQGKRNAHSTRPHEHAKLHIMVEVLGAEFSASVCIQNHITDESCNRECAQEPRQLF